MKLDDQTKRRMTRYLGTDGFNKRGSRKTRVTVTFDLFTPKRDYFDPANDEVLIIDLLDHIAFHAMDAHDVPGFQLVSTKINDEEIL